MITATPRVASSAAAKPTGSAIAAPAVVAPAKPTATLAPPTPVQVMPVDSVPAPAPVPAAAAAPEATPAPVPAAEAPPAVPLTVDQKIAQKIQELIGTKGDRVLDRKYKAAVEAYYQAHSYAPVWIDDGRQNKRAKAAIAYLGGVDADGLDPADYIVPSFAGDEAALAEAELKMTAAVLQYARFYKIKHVLQGEERTVAREIVRQSLHQGIDLVFWLAAALALLAALTAALTIRPARKQPQPALEQAPA